METLWFVLIGLMLTAYVVLDGFDLGAGIVHLLVARDDRQRREVLASIGPLWDGNEVWLLASGGIIVYAFPRAYASGFSGFYLPLTMVLWLLVMRGLSIELRSKEENPLWRSFWDGVFFFSSSLMAIVLGAALGNIIRGVPIGSDGYFAGPLFTDFRVGPNPGVLDWYTVSVGVFALLVLAAHAALYLTWKCSGEVHARARGLVGPLWGAVGAWAVCVTAMTAWVQPGLFEALLGRPLAWLLVPLVVAAFVGVFVFTTRGRELFAFLCSVAFITGMLGGVAVGMYPRILVSTINPAYTLDITNAAAGQLSLRVGVLWWSLAMLLAIGYFTYLFWSFRGKVDVDESHY
jgi:cytochrome bd ubiquinol oxidase subunit II